MGAPTRTTSTQAPTALPAPTHARMLTLAWLSIGTRQIRIATSSQAVSRSPSGRASWMATATTTLVSKTLLGPRLRLFEPPCGVCCRHMLHVWRSYRQFFHACARHQVERQAPPNLEILRRG